MILLLTSDASLTAGLFFSLYSMNYYWFTLNDYKREEIEIAFVSPFPVCD